MSKAARSKAPKPGAASKARAEPKALSGAERRNPKLRAGEEGESKSRGTNSWEGSRSRPGGSLKRRRSSRRGSVRPGGGGKPNTKKGITKQAKRTGNVPPSPLVKRRRRRPQRPVARSFPLANLAFTYYNCE